ncbi:MAG TPA: thiamine-phosphate kinase [Magnetospirillaceae bacterium]
MPAPDEFDLIRNLFAPLATDPGALDLRDDAALVDCPPGHSLVMTTDAIVAGVHYLPDDAPELVARKLVRVNLSDLAAMGAIPKGLLLVASFARNATATWMEEFAGGLAADCNTFGVSLLGGDTVATPGPATFALTAIGMVETGKELRRSRAQVGDTIWVSGTIGDGAFGLVAARGEASALKPNDIAALSVRYRLPEPRLKLGRALIGIAHAAMDISDGLVGDLGHICEASGVGAVVNADQVPLSDAGRAAIEAGLGQGLATALTGGDDYELLFTAPPDAEERLETLGADLGLRLTPIGEIITGSGVRVERASGKTMTLPARGYRHFGS